MSPRARVSLVVTAAAAAAAGITIAATSLTGEGVPHEVAPTLRPGVPPLVLDLGVRTDPEARALRRAAALFELKRYRRAGGIFRRYSSSEARVGAALSAWPASVDELAALAAARPRSGVVQLAAGLGELWRGNATAARSAWRRARRVEPDSLYAVRAGDLLHPEYPVPGLPVFVPARRAPAALDRLAPPAQLAFLRKRARGGDVDAKLLYGVALQRLNRPVSAEQQFRAAAKRASRDPEALTAAAVGLFDKDRPARAFSRLGPLARAYPQAATIRFHLGLMLLWLGRVDDAKRQLRLAKALEPESIPGKQAAAFLARLR
jgi:tetratricopeptide (TPR) repeat protein